MNFQSHPISLAFPRGPSHSAPLPIDPQALLHMLASSMYGVRGASSLRLVGVCVALVAVICNQMMVDGITKIRR
jgi:hypothetical protein